MTETQDPAQLDDLWSAAAWSDRTSPVAPLAEWIEGSNHRLVRDQAGAIPRFDGRTDGTFTRKTRSLAFDDVLDSWTARGLTPVVDEMGQVNWIGMMPEAVLSGAGHEVTLLLVLHDADYDDPLWAMKTLAYYEELLDDAARDGVLVLFVVSDGVDRSHMYIDLLQEVAVRFHLGPTRILLETGALTREGVALADVPGFTARTADLVEPVLGTTALDIADQWQNRVSLTFQNATADRSAHPGFDLAALTGSETGQALADGMAIEHDFDDARDPRLSADLHARGLRLGVHTHDSADLGPQQWLLLSAAPETRTPVRGLPVLLVFHEVTALAPFQSLSALAEYREWFEPVARGELALLFFALESPDDNDLFVDILRDAADLLPIDDSRVYVTGHSHNGHFAMEFARRHHEAIAAVAQLGNAYGLPAPRYSREAVTVTDESVALMATYDMPTIDIGGYSESDFVNHPVGSPAFADAVDGWGRRLESLGRPPLDVATVAAALVSDDPVERRLGVPVDRSHVEVRFGGRCFVGDIDDSEGRHRLRLIALENLPHLCAPQMPGLTWDFVRRFSRDRATGQILEKEPEA